MQARPLEGIRVLEVIRSDYKYKFTVGEKRASIVCDQPTGDCSCMSYIFVGAMRASKSRPDWGIVVLPSELINQDGNVVQHGEHRLMVPRRPGAF